MEHTPNLKKYLNQYKMEAIRKVIKIGNRYIGLEKYNYFQIRLDLTSDRGGIDPQKINQIY